MRPISGVHHMQFDQTALFIMDIAGLFMTVDHTGRAWVFQVIGLVNSLPPPCVVSVRRKLHRVQYGGPRDDECSVIITGDEGKTFRSSPGEVMIGDEILWNCTRERELAHREGFTLKYEYDRDR